MRFQFWADEVSRAAEHRPVTRAMEDVAPPNDDAVRAAIAVVAAGLDIGLEPKEVTDTAAEGIGIWFQRGVDYVLVECDNDGDMAVLVSNAEGDRTWIVGNPCLHESLAEVQRVLGARGMVA